MMGCPTARVYWPLTSTDPQGEVICLSLVEQKEKFSVNISIINFLKSETITNLNWSGMIDIAVPRRITFLKTWNKLQNIFPKLPDKSQKHFLSWRNYNLKEKGLYQKFPKIPQKWLVLSIACKNITIYMYIQYIKNRKQRWISDCKNESILKMFGTELKFHKY